MRRPSCDEDNLLPTDFVCDFCGATWADDRPMVEGHQGSLICRRCLDVAYTELWMNPNGEPLPEGSTCALCLESRDDPCFRGPVIETAFACKRCVKQSVVMLERDEDTHYERPGGRKGEGQAGGHHEDSSED